MKDDINRCNNDFNYDEDEEEDIAAMIPSSSSIAVMNKLNMKHLLATCLSSIVAIKFTIESGIYSSTGRRTPTPTTTTR